MAEKKTTKEKTSKVTALGPYKVKNKDFSYEFVSGETYDIPENHVNILLDMGVVEK